MHCFHSFPALPTTEFGSEAKVESCGAMDCVPREATIYNGGTQNTPSYHMVLRHSPDLTAESRIIHSIICNNLRGGLVDRAVRGVQWKEIESWIFPAHSMHKYFQRLFCLWPCNEETYTQGETLETYWGVVSISDTVSVNSRLHIFLPKLRNTSLKNLLNVLSGLHIEAHLKPRAEKETSQDFLL